MLALPSQIDQLVNSSQLVNRFDRAVESHNESTAVTSSQNLNVERIPFTLRRAGGMIGNTPICVTVRRAAAHAVCYFAPQLSLGVSILVAN